MPRTGIAGAVPVPNTVPVLGRPTTIVTYLWGGSTLNGGELLDTGREYGDRLGPDSHVIGVTGAVPVQVEQGRVVKSRLEWVEIATFVAVALILTVTFRSPAAPLVTLLTAVVAYLITIHLIGGAASRLGISAPSQLEPVIVALTLGLSTDYSIFFLSGMRYRMACGWSAHDALRSSITHNLPIVLTAGLTVTAGVASISVADLPLFKAFGPGLAIMVAVALLVSITLVPALLAILGRFALWPGTRAERVRRHRPPVRLGGSAGPLADEPVPGSGRGPAGAGRAGRRQHAAVALPRLGGVAGHPARPQFGADGGARRGRDLRGGCPRSHRDPRGKTRHHR